MTRRQTNRLYILLTAIVLMLGILLFQISTTFEAAELEKTTDVKDVSDDSDKLIDVENEDIHIQEVVDSDNLIQVKEEEAPKANKRLNTFSLKNIFAVSAFLFGGVIIMIVTHEKHKKSDEEDFTI